MPQVELYLQGAGGTYRIRKANIDGLLIRNKRDRQIYLNAFPRTIVPDGPVQSSDSLHEVLTKPDPVPDVTKDKLVAFYEDNYPYGIPFAGKWENGDVPMNDVMEGYAGILAEEALQRNAGDRATREASNEFKRTLPLIIVSGVVVILALLAVLIIGPEVLG